MPIHVNSNGWIIPRHSLCASTACQLLSSTFIYVRIDKIFLHDVFCSTSHHIYANLFNWCGDLLVVSSAGLLGFN